MYRMSRSNPLPTCTSADQAKPHRRFQGVYDIRQAVDAAAEGRVLHPLVLGAVATTLGAAARLHECLGMREGGQRGRRYPALQQLAAGLLDALPALRQDIERCVQVREQGAAPHAALIAGAAEALGCQLLSLQRCMFTVGNRLLSVPPCPLRVARRGPHPGRRVPCAGRGARGEARQPRRAEGRGGALGQAGARAGGQRAGAGGRAWLEAGAVVPRNLDVL
jgi:hypothetical protein